jgi:hypothetical protein
VGERTYRQELQADVIVVRQVQMVRLRPIEARIPDQK